MDAPANIVSGTFDAFNSQLQTKTLKATRSALALPADVTFHRSMDSSFSWDLDAFSSGVLSLTNKLLALVATADATQSSRAKGKAKLENQDDVVDNFHSLVVDSMDQLLERTDICLDQYHTKVPALAVNPPIQKKQVSPRGQLDPVIQHASHLKKPQLSFKHKVENNNLPWHPTLSHKYNAKVPLGYEYHDSDVDIKDGDSHLISSHPYRYEITHISYPETMFQTTIPIPPKAFKDTPFTWVATSQDFRSMLSKLRKVPEIAVDLEHHSYRSFAGFLCLMQISTREEDWIIDTLALREELTDLNEILTNPKIVKVFHGADHDIVWLQQDFNIFVVNLFDTYHASKVLDFPRHGLANLLEMYCDFTPDKRYQLADWRIRPLPEEMLQYARSDTHFLLYIYDNLRNALLDRATSRAQSRAQSPSLSNTTPHPGNAAHELIKQILSRSEETALRMYEKEVYDAEGGSGSNGWDTLARKWNKGALMAGGPNVSIGALQRAVYKGVHKWRDAVAREDDESIRYVLPNHFLFQLAEQPPTDMAALLKVFPSVLPVIRRRAKELLDVIKGCVTSHLTDISPPFASASQDSSSTRMDEAETSHPIPKANLASPPSLWTHDWSQGSSDSTTTTSSLFGATLSTVRGSLRATNIPMKSRSSLFGNMIRRTSLSVNQGNPYFRELVARINSTLLIMPSMPKTVVEQIPQDSTTSEDVTMQDPVLGMAVEIPFIPASQRKAMGIVEDSIVVVGQARQKKRKRTKAAVNDLGSSRSAESLNKKKIQQERVNGTPKNEVTSDKEEPFDFSVVPNILDNNPNLEESAVKKKKQRRQKNGEAFYGDFPAPPKAYSELKRGNQSHTFK